MKHSCIIGLLHHPGYSELLTLEELKLHIKEYDKMLLMRFDYCPKCGRAINWEQIRQEDT